MRIECPGCETAYEVSESQMRPGRSVRCAQCDRQWVPLAEPAEAAALPSVEPVPETAAAFTIPEPPDDEHFADPPVTADGQVRLRRSAAPRPMPATGVAPAMAGLRIAGFRLRRPPLPWLWLWSSLRPSGLGWAASVLVLAGLLVAAGHWRMAIMQGWPPSVRLYTALGARSPPT